MGKMYFFYWTDSVTSKGYFVYTDTEKERDQVLHHYFEASLGPLAGVKYPKRAIKFRGVIR
jgi:hypothetical protein